MYYFNIRYIPKCFEFHIIFGKNLEKQFYNFIFIVHIISSICNLQNSIQVLGLNSFDSK